MRAVFITGTDTDVGKTFISALFTQSLGLLEAHSNRIRIMSGDTETVQELTNLLEDRFERPQIELNIPLFHGGQQ